MARVFTFCVSQWRRAVAAAAICGVSMVVAAPAATASPFEGLWYDDTGRGAVMIERCGRSLCGHITWLRSPFKKNGQPLTDALNPSGRKRKRLICGLQVIGGLRPMSDGTWDRGWIYDPKQGKQFDVALSLRNRNTLVVLGYLNFKFMSKTLIWKRAPDTLEPCANEIRAAG